MSRAKTAEPKLTPEMRARLERIATGSGQTTERVLNDLVQEGWVRYAARSGIKPEEW